jgi:transposase
MFLLPPSVRIFLCRQPADMRRSFDGLAALAREIVRQDPLSGHIFVFRNRLGDRAKLLWWDRSGFCLFYKRLEEGTFQFPTSGEVTAGELMLLLEGIELSGAMRQKRFSLPPA